MNWKSSYCFALCGLLIFAAVSPVNAHDSRHSRNWDRRDMERVTLWTPPEVEVGWVFRVPVHSRSLNSESSNESKETGLQIGAYTTRTWEIGGTAADYEIATLLGFRLGAAVSSGGFSHVTADSSTTGRWLEARPTIQALLQIHGGPMNRHQWKVEIAAGQSVGLLYGEAETLASPGGAENADLSWVRGTELDMSFSFRPIPWWWYDSVSPIGAGLRIGTRIPHGDLTIRSELSETTIFEGGKALFEAELLLSFSF